MSSRRRSSTSQQDIVENKRSNEHDNELSELERNRLENIRRNQEFLGLFIDIVITSLLF